MRGLFGVRMHSLIECRFVVSKICLENLRGSFEKIHVEISLLLLTFLSYQDRSFGLLFEGGWNFWNCPFVVVCLSRSHIFFSLSSLHLGSRWFFLLFLLMLPLFRLTVRTTTIFIANSQQKRTTAQLVH